jgi:hypothetical protein
MNNSKENNIRQILNYLEERSLKSVVIMIVLTLVLGVAAICFFNFIGACPASANCPPGYKLVQSGPIVTCKLC